VSTYADWVLQPALPDDAVEPVQSLVVCCTQRSGSWLLCGLLDSTGRAGRPHEWFSPPTETALRERWRTASDADYGRAVLRAGTTANGVFAAKVTWSEIGRLPTLPAPRYVWLRREDRLAQAVSWALAGQTGLYHDWDSGPGVEPRYDPGEIDGFLRLIDEHELGWEGWFAERSIEPLVVRYEDLLERPEDETRRVLSTVGVDAAGVHVQTERRADGVAQDWVCRYRETVEA
jgi:LPS sulfotransferase NodH